MLNYFKNKNIRRGFTLIELLVVISIIGMLSSIVLASLNSARVKAREVRRKSDMHTLELALQQYYNDNGHYPADSGTSGGDWSNAFKSDLAPYLSQVPIDPIIPNGYPVSGYYYIAGVDTSGLGWGQDGPKAGASPCNDHFFVWFIMEVPKYPNPDAYTQCWNPSGTGSYLYARDLGKP